MFTANYHTHTTRCKHARGSDREYVEAAVKAGLTTLGFADHAPQCFPDGYVSPIRMDPEETGDYFASLLALKEEYKNRIDIKIGFEAEYYPDIFGDFLELIAPYPCDYLILGQHSVKNEYDHRDTPPRGTMEYVDLYIDQACRAMRTGYFTYFAHPDLAFCQGYPPEYYRKMEGLIACSIETGVPIELNGYGLMHDIHYPHKPFWKLAGEMGASVVLGIDAHDPQSILQAELFAEARKWIEECGLTLAEPILRPVRSAGNKGI